MIPSITDALKCLGLDMKDVHHYHGRDDALVVVTNDALKFVVTAADVALLQPAPTHTPETSQEPASPPAIMPEPMRVIAHTHQIRRPRRRLTAHNSGTQ